MSGENTQLVNDYRSRILAGETIPAEELAQAVDALRGDRAAAADTSSASHSKKPKVKAEDAMAKLNALMAEKADGQGSKKGD